MELHEAIGKRRTIRIFKKSFGRTAEDNILGEPRRPPPEIPNLGSSLLLMIKRLSIKLRSESTSLA